MNHQKVASNRTVTQGLAMMAQQCGVYTHRILCNNAFVDLKEFFCICSVNIELSKVDITVKNKHKNVKWNEETAGKEVHIP